MNKQIIMFVHIYHKFPWTVENFFSVSWSVYTALVLVYLFLFFFLASGSECYGAIFSKYSQDLDIYQTFFLSKSKWIQLK